MAAKANLVCLLLLLLTLPLPLPLIEWLVLLPLSFPLFFSLPVCFVGRLPSFLLSDSALFVVVVEGIRFNCESSRA